VSAAILLDQDIETSMVFKILAGIGIIGLLIFGFLRQVSKPVKKDLESSSGNVQNEPKPTRPKILEVVLFMTVKRAALLAPLLLYSGITQSFFFGSLPLFINEFSTEINDLSMKLVRGVLFIQPFFPHDS